MRNKLAYLAACAAAALSSLGDLLHPDVLLMPDGTRITSAQEWSSKARPQILDFFEKNVYGKIPPRPAKLEFVLAENGDDALGGLAKRRQYRIVSTDVCGTHSFDVLVYLPKDAAGPVPAFVCPNFNGNHAITDDPNVILPTCPLYRGLKPDDPERGRGWRLDYFPVRDVVKAGFAAVTFCHCDVYPDYSHTRGRDQREGAAESVWRIFAPEKRDRQLALAAWAWGDMRAMDLVCTIPEIDARKVVVAGHSRLGWASVIAAAYDERFAMCCPNAGGSKPITLVPNLLWPAWFAPELTNWTSVAKYNMSPDAAEKQRGGKPLPPFEQASLIGCIAPRALHIGTSTRDVSAPPGICFGTAKSVEPVYRLFGKTNFPDESQMLAGKPFLGDISWHCKEGDHSLTREDWSAYIADARRVFRMERQKGGKPFSISKDDMPEIVIQEGLRPFVTKAAEDVARDLEKIFGVRPKIAVVNGQDAYGTTNSIVLFKNQTTQPPSHQTTQPSTGWENYTIESVVGNVLKIMGSDDRGVMFGLYRFASECLGVDPFYFWSGREPEKAESKSWDGISISQGDPSFKFRGWFINDEDFLNGFRPKENGKRAIKYSRYNVVFGPSLADAIYETAVRSGFNMMICASYVDILNPDEKRLIDIASSRGLYITTHHQEALGAGALQLDLHFPEIRGTTYASHPDLWREAWKRYIDEWAKVPDVVWQLGLRGRRDLPFWIMPGDSRNRGKSDEEEDRRRAGLISSAMREQLAMIERAKGRRPEHYATQLWMEGAELYRRGLLDVPEGTIVIFSDNSAGMKFQSDIGGVKALDHGKKFGLYYHLALVHGNHRCELVPPLRTRQILGDAWRKGARELVLFNVSNVRPFLYTIEAAGEMTRDIGAFDADDFRDRWVKARFGENAAVARAIDLYFAAYETEYSRDALSSYGSPRERAPLAILHDGMVTDGLARQIARYTAHDVIPPKPVGSQYVADPDALVSVADNMMSRVNQDQHASLKDKRRYRLRAFAQAAAFNECVEQVERASKGLDEAQKRQLFERFGYPARFMALSSGAFAEMSSALADMDLRDDERALSHAKQALSLLERRDELDRQYNGGKWKHWYDRDIIYPCRSVTEKLRKSLKGR